MHHPVLRGIAAVLVVLGVLAGATGPGVAVAKRAPHKAKARTGWPWDHQPEADPPAPKDASAASAEAQSEGMTDAEFAVLDPEGYAAVMPESRRIEARLKAQIRARSVGPDDGSVVGSGTVEAGSQVIGSLAVTTPYSPYGYLKFVLVPGTGSMTYNGYRGTLYFRYGYYVSYLDSYRWYTVAYPAISGNNIPRYQAVRNVGPIPEYTWDFGFLYSSFRGFEYDSRTSFYPGKWRLDPWTGGPYGRGYLEVHGGTSYRYFKPTAGCIRLTPASINSLQWFHRYRMTNKYDRGSAHLYVDY